MRYETLRDLDEAELDIRIWCYGCARAVECWSGVWADWERRGWSITIEDARKRFVCHFAKRRGARHDILIVPIRRPPPKSWANEVAGAFHSFRSENKKRRIK